MLYIIIGIALFVPVIRRILFSYLPKVPKFLYLKTIDTYRHIKYKEWLNFNGFGLKIYVGLFGAGKTISMIEKAYRIAKAFPQVKILTNMKLEGFPKHTKIIPLTNFKQIIDIDGNTLIIIDEISTILNSRRWDKDGVPPALLGQLLQVRKQRKMLLSTAQRFHHVDKLIRDITHTVIDCDTYFNRWTIQTAYDAEQYESQNTLKPAVPMWHYNFLQTEKIRKLFDTWEIIDNMKKEEFLTDKEILDKQGSSTGDIIIGIDKKKRKLLK